MKENVLYEPRSSESNVKCCLFMLAIPVSNSCNLIILANYIFRARDFRDVFTAKSLSWSQIKVFIPL